LSHDALFFLHLLVLFLFFFFLCSTLSFAEYFRETPRYRGFNFGLRLGLFCDVLPMNAGYDVVGRLRIAASLASRPSAKPTALLLCFDALYFF
jgi:hypothetical protein